MGAVCYSASWLWLLAGRCHGCVRCGLVGLFILSSYLYLFIDFFDEAYAIGCTDTALRSFFAFFVGNFLLIAMYCYVQTEGAWFDVLAGPGLLIVGTAFALCCYGCRFKNNRKTKIKTN